MVSLNNPAGRLYSLLGRLRDGQGNVPIVEAWALILGDEGAAHDAVRARLGTVAQLVWEIDAAVQHPGREQVAAPVARYRNTWLDAAFPLQRSFVDPVENIKPNDESYEALGMVAAYLEAIASEGPMPSEERRSGLVDDVRIAIQDVSTSDELPPEVARLIIQRLSDVEKALWYIEIGGPEAVRRATEALMGTAVAASVPDEKTRKSDIMKRVMAVAASVYVVFTAGPAIQNSIDAWSKVAGELTAAPAHVAGPAAHQTGDATAPDDQPATDHDDNEASTTP